MLAAQSISTPFYDPRRSLPSPKRSPSPSRRVGLSALMELISIMSVDDIDDVLSKRGSSPIEANMSDNDLALALFAEEAEGLLNFTKDHLTDGAVNNELLDELLEIEETAHYDHIMAIALSEGKEPPPRPPPRIRGKNRAVSQPQHSHASSSNRCHNIPVSDSNMQRGRSRSRLGSSSTSSGRPISPVPSLSSRASSPEAFLEDNIASRAASPIGNYSWLAAHMRGSSRSSDGSPVPVVEPYEEEGSVVGSRSASPEALTRSPSPSAVGFPFQPGADPVRECHNTPEPEAPPPCVVCGDETEGTVFYAPCGHVLDVACLHAMVENATRDESLFPPKCCQDPIQLTHVERFLDKPLRELYERKSREFSIKDRVYCHVPDCSTFLGSASAGPTTMACPSPSCHARTCGSCKYAAHPGEPCEDHSDDLVLELGQNQGWQRCPSCRHLVELAVGCYHMTCQCQMQFCYLCSKTWKTCSCPLFEDVPDTPV